MRYKENPLISVIIPIYNVEEYLRECLNSIINQTYRNLEIILVNDGSTDDSPSICDEYVSMDNRIRVIHQNNKGLVGARKSGISVATGDIATFVDSDDWIDLNMYEVMVEKMIESEADIVTSGLIREYGRHFINDVETIKPGVYSGDKLEKVIKSNLIDEGKFFRSNVSMHIYNKLFERELLLKNELLIIDDISVGEDAACVYPCILDANKIAVIDRCFYHYRIRNNSIMGQTNDADLISIKKLYQYLYQRFNNYSNKLKLENQLRLLIVFFVILASPHQLMNGEKEYFYYYPQVKKGSRIIIYGAGRAGKAVMQMLKDSKDYKIVGWLDKNNLECDFNQLEYDYIIIAAYTYSAHEDIYKDLINKGVSKSKIADLDLSEILDIDEIFF
ncbi:MULTISPECIES: glycosyltransferase [unclassified Lacrimispora]|uniref:glycosyltransferase n=1 Tax=unclassified Lacrimispora TaxID=2719232 RepID=UPI00376F9F74